jgi:hypothetical protein
MKQRKLTMRQFVRTWMNFAQPCEQNRKELERSMRRDLQAVVRGKK